jgi:hypothetical protein
MRTLNLAISSTRGVRAVTDYGPQQWLQMCLDGARDMLTWTKENSPAHEDEVVAEIQFWTAALQFLASGAEPPADRTAPPTVTLESAREAADYTISRYRESLDSDAPEPLEEVVGRDITEWQRLRDFVDAY